MEPTDLADILRDEADRLNKSANKFSGWQAVADSLVRLADALASGVDTREHGRDRSHREAERLR